MREIKTSSMSMDSTASLRGEDLGDHLRKELSLFYDKAAWESWLGAAVGRIDFSDVEMEWWTAEPDTAEEIEKRMDALLALLSQGRHGSSSILVGHSMLFRSLCRSYMTPSADTAIWKDIADSVRTHTVPNCSVIGLAIEYDGLRRSIVEVVPLLGAQLEPAGVPMNMFPLPPSQCCLPQERHFGSGADGLDKPQVSQPRQCVFTSCSGPRIFS